MGGKSSSSKDMANVVRTTSSAGILAVSGITLRGSFGGYGAGMRMLNEPRENEGSGIRNDDDHRIHIAL